MRARVTRCLVLALGVAFSAAAAGRPTPVLEALEEELGRSMAVLGKQPQPPYFLSYEITDLQRAEVVASFGTLTSSTEERRRELDIDLRVGDHDFDSTHELRGDRGDHFFDSYSFVEVPVEDDVQAIRGLLWYHTDRRHKRALERFTKVATDVTVKVDEEDRSADLSREEPVQYVEEPQELLVDLAAWEERVRRYSRPFAAHGAILEAGSQLLGLREIRWFVSSEGTRLQTSRLAFRLVLSATTKADDGMELPRYESFFAYDPADLPDDDQVLATVERMIADLEALRRAPLVEPYTGPAILSGRASGVFFHEIFGHRVEGHRQRSEEDAQTFKKMVGEKILPDSFSVVFDPTVERVGAGDLAGYYRYDNQGVAARPVKVVENGVLKRFLMSRKPIEGFPTSNGHGRRAPGFAPVSRQSNLIVEVEGAVSRDELRRMLIERVEAEGKPFGLLFDDIAGGFTFTGRSIPNAFNVIPVMVYRVFPDGRQELVRGVDLIGTPLTAFSKIVAGDDSPAVFNGTCDAESGGVPVAAVSPAILVSQIEVQKQEKSQARPPLLGPPLADPGNTENDLAR